MDPAERRLLRHMLATLAYRGGKAIRNAQPGFGEFLPEGVKNSPVVLLSHICDLIEWAHRWAQSGAQGVVEYRTATPGYWVGEVDRFHAALGEFDTYLAEAEEVGGDLETLIQAPIADSLTHIGQIALLRRMAGDAVLGEAYRLAEIEIGRVGPEQAAPGREFALDQGAVWREK